MGSRKRFFDRAYRQGRTPWDSGITPPEVVAFVEGNGSPGRALDLGCGTGTNALYLARHRWQVVGLDFSELAIGTARTKLLTASLPGVTFLHGDVTQLAAEGVTGFFDFVLDIGCFHGVPPRKRDHYVREVAEHTRAGATLLMFAFGSSMRAPGRHPTRESEIRRRFGASFDVTHIELGTRPPGAAWFTLRRRPGAPEPD
jgi:SAM-dependent methyltransferase